MPEVSDFEELDLTGMEIESIQWSGEILRHRFGSGYGAKTVVGNPSGIWGWEIMSDALTDDDAHNDLIDSVPSFQYYQEFIREHTTGDSDVFQIDFRGRKFHASFVESTIAGTMHTYDLFGLGGVQLEMRRVPGIYYRSDGSIFDPSFATGVWGWYKGDAYTGAGPYEWTDQIVTGTRHHLTSNADVLPVADVVNDYGVMRLNSVGGSGFFNTTQDPSIFEAFFLMKVREATFSTFQGILTCHEVNANPGGGALMVGDNGQTKLVNLAFGGIYSYRKDGVLLTEATQNAPMNTFGVIHGRWTTAILATNLQIGKDRDIAARYLKADICEVVLCDALLSAADSADIDGYLMRRGGIA